MKVWFPPKFYIPFPKDTTETPLCFIFPLFSKRNLFGTIYFCLQWQHQSLRKTATKREHQMSIDEWDENKSRERDLHGRIINNPSQHLRFCSLRWIYPKTTTARKTKSEIRQARINVHLIPHSSIKYMIIIWQTIRDNMIISQCKNNIDK